MKCLKATYNTYNCICKLSLNLGVDVYKKKRLSSNIRVESTVRAILKFEKLSETSWKVDWWMLVNTESDQAMAVHTLNTHMELASVKTDERRTRRNNRRRRFLWARHMKQGRAGKVGVYRPSFIEDLSVSLYICE